MLLLEEVAGMCRTVHFQSYFDQGKNVSIAVCSGEIATAAVYSRRKTRHILPVFHHTYSARKGSRCYAHGSPRARITSLSLGMLKWKYYRVDFEDSRKGWILMFLDISRFIFSPPPHTLYKHIVAVKAMIDKQSPHEKLLFKSGFHFRNGLCLFISISFEMW